MLPLVSCRSAIALARAAVLLVVLAGSAGGAWAVPEVQNVSPRGLQAGATTRLTLDGSDLLPDSRLLLPFAVSGQAVKPGSTPNRLQLDVTVPADTAPGIYLLRVTNARGVSIGVPLGVDELPQVPFGPQTAALPAALHGSVAGSDTARTTFVGKKGQRIVADVEARRLGSLLDPLVELYDSRRVLLAHSLGLPALSGDARLEAVLPADGTYTVELRDALYRAGSPGHFRLKIGELRFASLAFPSGVQRGVKTDLHFVGALPADAHVQAELPTPGDAAAPLPRVPGIIGPAPRLIVGDFPEIVESPQPAGKVQDVPVPGAINGRIEKPGEEDRFRLLVQPGMNLRIDVLANRLGSPLDGVLSVRNATGGQLASADDSPDSVDPSLTFTVPQGVKEIALVISDALGRGGPSFIYRIAVRAAGQPDFGLTVLDERVNVPLGGTAVVRVRANRTGYTGPIRLSLPGLPSEVTMAGNDIPASVNDTLLSLTAPAGLKSMHVVTSVIGDGGDSNTSLRRTALLPETAVTRGQPWLRAEVAAAVTEPGALTIAWDAPEPALTAGTPYAAKVRLTRAAGVTGPVRLALLTSQVVPKLPNTQNDDVNKAIRVEGAPVIAAAETVGEAKVLVPATLPMIPYDLVVRAELLSADGKQVRGTAVTPSLRVTVRPPPPAPALVRLFEDEADFVKLLTEGEAQATLETTDRYSGTGALRVTPSQRFRTQVPGWNYAIKEKPGAGEFRYLKFAWKKKGGDNVLLQLSANGAFGPARSATSPAFRYEAGPAGNGFNVAAIKLNDKLPDEWVVVTRDLFADFGAFSLTGIAFTPGPGEVGLFDHVYLARTQDDLKSCPEPIKK